MKYLSLLAGFLSCIVGAAVHAEPATSQSASMGLTSTLSKGIVSIMTDPTLADGRLVLKVVAHNPTSQPLQLNASDVRISTAAGKPITVLSLDQLIAEATGTSRKGGTVHDTAGYARPQQQVSRAGELDVTGMTGGSGMMNSPAAERGREERKVSDDPAVQQQVEALQAGILQTATVEPGKAIGGQLVTEKIKFSRKEAKVLHVTVDFNGEQHQFDFEAPPSK